MKLFYKIFIIVFIIIISYSIYEQVNNSKKIKRVNCQNKTITFEKIFSIENNKNLLEAKELLQSNNYTLLSEIEYSKNMKSNLITILSKKQADEKLNKVISNYTKENKVANKSLYIDYYIYENDKEDKGKKGKKSKLYAGYLVFEFKYKNQLLYKIQTDYMDINASDIEERMNCVIKSFLLINNK